MEACQVRCQEQDAEPEARRGEQSADANGPAGASPRPEREPRGRGSAAAERRREAWSAAAALKKEQPRIVNSVNAQKSTERGVALLIL